MATHTLVKQQFCFKILGLLVDARCITLNISSHWLSTAGRTEATRELAIPLGVFPSLAMGWLSLVPRPSTRATGGKTVLVATIGPGCN